MLRLLLSTITSAMSNPKAMNQATPELLAEVQAFGVPDDSLFIGNGVEGIFRIFDKEED